MLKWIRRPFFVYILFKESVGGFLDTERVAISTYVLHCLLLTYYNFMKHSGTCLSCLAAADKLPFEVAHFTLNMISQLEKKLTTQPDYKLVILCSSTQQYIPSLLLEVSNSTFQYDLSTELRNKLFAQMYGN